MEMKMTIGKDLYEFSYELGPESSAHTELSCPVGKTYRVGSDSCTKCSNFIGRDRIAKTVLCAGLKGRLEMEKEKEDKDFRVGDVVCTHTNGTGKVVAADKAGLSVGFEKKRGEKYAQIRTFIGSECDYVMHGTWEQIFGNVKDVKPVRIVERFVNLYAVNGSITAAPDLMYMAKTYASTEDAESAADDKCVSAAVPVQIPEDMV